MRSDFAVIVGALLSPVAAQPAASETVFLPSQERAAGGTAQSSSYRADLVVGAGVLNGRGTSSIFVCDGGLAPTLETVVSGRPWLVGAREIFAPPTGGVAVTLYGTELHLGTNPNLTIGGQPATVGTRDRYRVVTTLPDQPAPGWQPARLGTSAGDSTLVDAVGVLPMLQTEPTAVSGERFDLLLKGMPGDRALFALGIGRGPPIRLGALRHGLELIPGTFEIFVAFPIPASGELRVPIPVVAWTGPIYAQAMFAGGGASYAPGSFSNVLVFR